MTLTSLLIDHSTETALLEAHSGIAGTVDKGSMAVVILLDLHASFVRHIIKALTVFLDIKEKALSWMKSHLTEPSTFLSMVEHDEM